MHVVLGLPMLNNIRCQILNERDEKKRLIIAHSLNAEGFGVGGITQLKAVCMWFWGRRLTFVLAFPSFLSSSLCSFNFYSMRRIGFGLEDFIQYYRYFLMK